MTDDIDELLGQRTDLPPDEEPAPVSDNEDTGVEIDDPGHDPAADGKDY